MKELFSNIGEYRELVADVEASASMMVRSAAYQRVKQAVQSTLSEEVWTRIIEITEQSEDDLKSLKYALQGAVGNYTEYHYLIFKISDRKTKEKTYFRYEIREMQENYLDSYWTWMDTLFSTLSGNLDLIPEFKESEAYKRRSELIIKDAVMFSRYFPIDNSEYFFTLTAYIQQEVIDEDIVGLIPDHSSIEDERLLRKLHRAVVYRTLALALQQFDYPSLPKTIRNDIFNVNSKDKGAQEKHVKEKLWRTYDEKAERYLSSLDLSVRSLKEIPEETSELNSHEDYSIEDDKFVIL